MDTLRAIGKSFAHPDEIFVMVNYKITSKKILKGIEAKTTANDDPDVRFCYGMLVKVSRSFSFVIQQLDDKTRDAICVFYLVLRGLDTIEDDTSLSHETRVNGCTDFYTHINEPGWNYHGAGKGDEKLLLEQFHRVVKVFNSLEPRFQEPIQTICRKMGAGMAKFIGKQVETLEEYNEYCHYVAGLVGIGLSKIFAASGLEDSCFGEPAYEKISNSMGLFLQKTNIIRDYLEDLVDGRTFWPKSVWILYAQQLGDFKDPALKNQALACLNHLVTDALALIPDCFEYMKRLKDPQIFRFCAIPQVMAIATLAAVFNNYGVFTGVVKIRRGISVKMIKDCDNMDAVYKWFLYFLAIIEKTARSVEMEHGKDALTLPWTLKAIADARKAITIQVKPKRDSSPLVVLLVLVLLISATFATGNPVESPSSGAILAGASVYLVAFTIGRMTERF